MRCSFTLSVLSLALGLVCPTTAHLLQRRAAGSDSTTATSSVPSEILTAATDSLTQTTSLPSASAISTLESSATATATATDSASGSSTTASVDKCNNPGGEYAPFCKPTNGSTLDFDTTYTVTWDTSYFDANATVVIEIEYANSSSQGNTSVYSTGELENAVGYASISPKEAWLQDSSSANLTFYFSMISADGTSDSNSATTMTGPTVSLGSSSQDDESTSQGSGSLLDSSSSTSKNGTNVGLVTGLTIGFAFLALALVSGFFVWYRRYMIRNRGYGVGKSRTQRLQERQRHPSWHGSSGGHSQQGRGNVRLGEMQSA